MQKFINTKIIFVLGFFAVYAMASGQTGSLAIDSSKQPPAAPIASSGSSTQAKEGDKMPDGWWAKFWDDPIDFFTLLLVVVGGLQIFWMVKTVRVMRATIDSMETSSEIELRAYITVDITPLSVAHEYGAINFREQSIGRQGWGASPCQIRIKMKNTGQTPTKGLVYEGGRFDIFDFPLPHDWNEIQSINRSKDMSIAVLGAGQDKSIVTNAFEIYAYDDFKKLKSFTLPVKRLYFYGRIEYLDVFGNERWTNFCYVLLPNGEDGDLTPHVSERGNDIY